MEPLAVTELEPVVFQVPVPVEVPSRRWPWILLALIAIALGAGAFVLTRRSAERDEERRREYAEELGSHAAPQPAHDLGNLVVADG